MLWSEAPSPKKRGAGLPVPLNILPEAKRSFAQKFFLVLFLSRKSTACTLTLTEALLSTVDDLVLEGFIQVTEVVAITGNTDN